MDGATIQAKVNYGYAKSAQYVGLPFQQCRPANALSPIVLPSATTLSAAFTVASTSFNFGKSPSQKDVLFQALVDASQVEVGDYLVGASDTYFIAGMQPLLPILAVRCNRTINIVRPGPSESFGANTNYGGTTEANEEPILTGWPASLIFDARGRATEVGLPTDLPSAYFILMMPALAGVDVRASDFFKDDLGRRYDINATERSSFGWRIWAQEAVT
jgi:hypothetical protein